MKACCWRGAGEWDGQSLAECPAHLAARQARVLSEQVEAAHADALIEDREFSIDRAGVSATDEVDACVRAVRWDKGNRVPGADVAAAAAYAESAMYPWRSR